MRWTPLILAALLAIYPVPAKADQDYHCSAGRQESWQYDEFPEGDVHEIALTGTDGIRLDGRRIGRAALLRHLRRSGRVSLPSFTRLVYDEETDCGLVQQVRVAMTRALPCHHRGRCGEHFRSSGPPPTLSKEELARQVADAVADLQAATNELRQDANEDPDPPDRR